MTAFTTDNFIKNLERLKTDNLFFFHGTESFFIDYLLDQLTAAVFPVEADKAFNLHKFYGTENTLPEILSSCMSYPMLSAKKMIIVKEFDKLRISQNDENSFIKYLNQPQTSSVLVLTTGKLESKKFIRNILELSNSVECKNLRTGELYNWIGTRFQQANIQVDRESITFLIENIGNDLLRLNQEVEKAIDFVGSTNKLTLDLITELTGFNREVNVFNLQKALGARKLNESLKIALQLLEQQGALELIVAMVYRFFSRIIIIKQLYARHESKESILNKLKQKEFQLTDAFSSTNNFTFEELTFIFEKIEEADVVSKTTSRTRESILTMLCYHICNPGKINFI